MTGTRGVVNAGESALGKTMSVAGKADRAAAAARLESVAGEGIPLTFYPMPPVNEMAPSTARTLVADIEKWLSNRPPIRQDSHADRDAGGRIHSSSQ